MTNDRLTVAKLGRLAEEYGRTVKEGTLVDTARELAEYPTEEVNRALSRCLREGGWTRDHSLLSFVLGKLAGNEEEAIARAWAVLTRHYPGPVKLSDPAAHQALRDLGGHQCVVGVDAWAQRDARKEFALLYRAAVREALPPVEGATVQTGTHNGRCLPGGDWKRIAAPAAAVQIGAPVTAPAVAKDEYLSADDLLDLSKLGVS